MILFIIYFVSLKCEFFNIILYFAIGKMSELIPQDELPDHKTYTEGFVMKFTKDMTKRVYMNILDRISDDLNELYAEEKLDMKVQLVPEPITEGGIKFTGGKFNTEWYKTMRHRCIDYKYAWPRIYPDTADEWRRSASEVQIEDEVKSNVLFKKGWTTQTFLKAFYRAPIWTLSELRIIKKNFELFGVKVTKMPKKKTLDTRTIY
jgi:hypothetical protein